MKSAVSPHAIEIGRALAQKTARSAATEQDIPKNLRATSWFPGISIHEPTCCQFFGCEKVFPLAEGFGHPLPIARMMNGKLLIRSSPVLVFCSLQHLFDATVVFGSVVTAEGKVRSLVRH